MKTDSSKNFRKLSLQMKQRTGEHKLKEKQTLERPKPLQPQKTKQINDL